MIIPFRNNFPETDESVFIAESAVVIGRVSIGKDSSVWFNTVIRGDVHYIRIGERTNIQDGSILHVTGDKFSLEIGDDVTIGHRAVIHGCKIGNNILIGMGAVVLDGAEIKPDSLIAAGSVVKEGFTVPSGVLVAGVPAIIIRNLTAEEIAGISQSAKGYTDLAKEYRIEMGMKL